MGECLAGGSPSRRGSWWEGIQWEGVWGKGVPAGEGPVGGDPSRRGSQQEAAQWESVQREGVPEGGGPDGTGSSGRVSGGRGSQPEGVPRGGAQGKATCSTRLIHWKLSSSVESGLCSATITILSSCRTVTENTAILWGQKGKHRAPAGDVHKAQFCWQ